MKYASRRIQRSYHDKSHVEALNKSSCSIFIVPFNLISPTVLDCQFDVLLGTVCKDCDAENGTLDFKGKEPICVGQLDHSTSPGGNTTVELLSIERGYWRASNTSTKILACYKANACQGGKTGALDYCLKGYEGPC